MCQHVESPSSYWLSTPGLPLQISAYTNFSRCCTCTDPIHWFCPAEKLLNVTSRSTNLKQQSLNRATIGPSLPVKMIKSPLPSPILVTLLAHLLCSTFDQ